jgi:hypothetical protein
MRQVFKPENHTLITCIIYFFDLLTVRKSKADEMVKRNASSSVKFHTFVAVNPCISI